VCASLDLAPLERRGDKIDACEERDKKRGGMGIDIDEMGRRRHLVGDALVP
jgi:hypothetical protein